MKRLIPMGLLLIFIVQSCTQETYQVGKIQTQLGEILVWLYDDTPEHKKAFIELVESGYWNDYTFNRVIPNFVAQGGCPDTPEGFAYSVHLLEPEFEAGHKHVYGAFGAGRDANPDKLSAACQFYIVQNEKGLPRLDGDYMIYGQVIKGMDVVNKVVNVERDSTNKPLRDLPLDVSIVNLNAKELKALGFEPNEKMDY